MVRRQSVRNTRVALVPPKPNELESVAPIFISRAEPGTSVEARIPSNGVDLDRELSVAREPAKP